MNSRRLFDVTEINYANDEERDRYYERNAETCEALNRGARFVLVFPTPILNEDRLVSWNGDIYWAVVVLANGSVMPYPLIEEAAQLCFRPEQVEGAIEERFGMVCPVEKFEEWLSANYKERYAGMVESDGVDPSDRRDAVAAGVRLIKQKS